MCAMIMHYELILKDGWTFSRWYTRSLNLWRIKREKLPVVKRRRKRCPSYPVNVTFVKPHVTRLPSRRPTAMYTRRPTSRGSVTPITWVSVTPTTWGSEALSTQLTVSYGSLLYKYNSSLPKRRIEKAKIMFWEFTHKKCTLKILFLREGPW